MQAPTPYCAHARQHTVDSAGRWRKRLGRFKMQALTHCDANVMSTHTTAGQFKCQFKGAMEHGCGFDSAQNSRRPATTHGQQ